MAEIALIYRIKPTQIEDIELDATLSETHTASADITDHPVEQGANIVDHARRKPDGLMIEGLVSNTPLSRDQMRRYISAGGVELETATFEDAPRGVLGYAERAFERLKALVGARLVTVVTGLESYPNMMLESLSVPRDSKTGDALKFTATFKQVEIVTNKLTTVETRVPGAKKKKALGAKAAVEKPKEEYSSALSKITGIGEVAESF
jgi:hypothetical protein